MAQRTKRIRLSEEEVDRLKRFEAQVFGDSSKVSHGAAVTLLLDLASDVDGIEDIVSENE